MPSYSLGLLEHCFLHLGHFFGRVPKSPLPPPPPLPLKFSDTCRRILFRVSLHKFICKETWYRAPNISTVAKYQKTVRNLYVSDSYSLRKRSQLTRTVCKKYSYFRTYEKNTQRMLAKPRSNVSFGFNNCPTTGAFTR